MLLLAGIAFAIYKATESPAPPTQVEVPNVSGKDVDTATRALENVKFVVSPDIEQRASSSMKEGLVIGTDPSAGDEAEEGSTVKLIVSAGPEQVTIPDLQGLSFDEAKDNLEAKGLKVKKQMQDSDVPRNQVINTLPVEGDKVDVGSTVTIIVSKGQVTVPNVVGQTVEQATKALEDLGLKVTTTPDPNAQVPEGTVTAQNIAPNEKVSPGTTIELTVSANPGQGNDGADADGTDGADVLGTEADGADGG